MVKLFISSRFLPLTWQLKLAQNWWIYGGYQAVQINQWTWPILQLFIFFLNYFQPLPEFPRIHGNRLDGEAFADCLMSLEFLHNFAKPLGFGKLMY